MQSIGIYEDYIAYARDPTSQVLGAASQFDYAQDDTGCCLLPPFPDISGIRDVEGAVPYDKAVHIANL